MGLDAEFIEQLLKGELEKAARGSTKTPTGGSAKNNGLPRPKQLGPLKWSDHTEPCAARGCTSPTYITIRGIRYCTTHALNTLNEIILRELELIDLSECTCKAGIYSKYNIHTFDCQLVKLSDHVELVEELL